jgi:repressor LexA
MALTRRQKEVLDFLADFIDRKGYSPSYEEIAEGIDLNSIATVHKHIAALESKGYLKRGFNQSRSVEISESYLAERGRTPATESSVPLLGRIAAGRPVEQVAQGDSLQFSDFAGNSSTFALQVRGESMIDDHICDGDFVLIEKAESARDGEIVVALVEGYETTLKRFYRESDGQVRLQPANSTMGPIVVPAAAVEIQGRLIAVMRKYKN